MNPENQVLIPEFGLVTIKSITLGMITNAEDIAHDKDYDAFVNCLLADMIAEPIVTSHDIKVLSDKATATLVKEAVKELDIFEEFHGLPEDMPVREKLHKALYESFAKIFHNFAKDFTNDFAKNIFNIKITIPGLNELQKQVQEKLATIEEELEKLAPMLEKANFWFTPYMPLGIIHQLRDLAQNKNTTPIAVEQVFVAHYEAENWARLKNMVNSWGNKLQFADRMPIVLDALDAHTTGKYTLSVPVLLTQVEGVASEIIGKSVWGGTGEKIADLLNEHLPERFRQAHKELLIKFVKEMIFYRVDFNDFAADLHAKKGMIEKDFLNRHSILHGVQTDYAYKEHSLRAFLLLDTLNHINTPGKSS